MITCTKLYQDFPFAHRQPNHDGHCAYIHGHNWDFEFTFQAIALDECGFVIDFGKLRWLKEYLTELFDHTLVINVDDPKLSDLRDMAINKNPVGLDYDLELFDLRVIPDCSCEGIARYLHTSVDKLVREETGGRVSVQRVVVFEDKTNSATSYHPPLYKVR